MVPFWRSSWISVVFLLIIYLGIFASPKHLLSSRASLSWMDVNFLNQNPCMPSWPGVFQFSTFLLVALSDSRCLSTSVLSFFFHVFLSFQLFCYVLPVPISYSKIILLPLHPVVGRSLCISILAYPVLFLLFKLILVSVSFKSPFFCRIAVWYNYTYTYTCGNIINNNDERTHFFRKIYLSHFIRKGCEELWVRGELETE